MATSDISLAAPLDELPKHSQKDDFVQRCFEFAQVTADNLTQRSLVERIYVPCLEVRYFKLQLNVTPISVGRRDATPGIIRKKHTHRDQSSSAISKTKSICRWQITEFHPRLAKWVYTGEVRRVGKQFNSHSNVYQWWLHSPAAPFNKPNFGHRLALAVCAWIDWPLWGRPRPTPHY